MTVAVLMPAFNEGPKIGAVLESMPSDLYGNPVRVVVVDDGSSDGTADIAMRCGADVLRQMPNQGKGAALCKGLDHIRDGLFEAVVWMDADGQHVSSSLPDLVGPVLFDGVDMAVGSRYLLGSHRSSAPLNRRLVRAASIRAVERVTGLVTTDPFSGFRCFSKSAIDVIRLDGCGYESELEALFAVANAGLTIKEVPIPRIYGPDTSKMGHRNGALLGRLSVIAGYARTIKRAYGETHHVPVGR